MAESNQLVIGGKPPAETPGAPAEGAKASDLGGGAKRVEVPSEITPPAPKEEKAPDDRPQWLPEKFKSAEDLAKAYKELETKLGQKPKAPTESETQKLIQDAGLDMGKLSQEWAANNGKLTDDTLKSLAAKGITKETVDAYAEGQAARAQAYSQKLAESVGGADALDTLFKWAAANMSEAEITEANNALGSMNEARAGLVLQGLHSRYTAANGKEPELLKGPGGPKSGDGPQPFADNDEVAKAISNPLYKTSEAYRKKVEARLAMTDMW